MNKYNLKNPVIVDKDPNDSDFFAIWTNETKFINATLAEGIGDIWLAKFIAIKINEQLNLI